MNIRNSNPDFPKLQYDENGRPLCSKDPSRTMKPTGWTREEGRSDRFKWLCPEIKYINGKYITTCQNPCNGKPCGRMTYTSPSQAQRMYPGVIRDSEEWVSEYKTRVVVEKDI